MDCLIKDFMDLNNAAIVKARQSLKEVSEFLKRTIVDAQINCSHESLAECNYVPSGTFTYARPPMRVCLNCGLVEEGWGCGYQVLRHKNNVVGVPPISRDDLYSLREGHIIDNEDKGPLLRKEKTLEDLIRGL